MVPVSLCLDERRLPANSFSSGRPRVMLTGEKDGFAQSGTLIHQATTYDVFVLVIIEM